MSVMFDGITGSNVFSHFVDLPRLFLCQAVKFEPQFADIGPRGGGAIYKNQLQIP